MKDGTCQKKEKRTRSPLVGEIERQSNKSNDKQSIINSSEWEGKERQTSLISFGGGPLFQLLIHLSDHCARYAKDALHCTINS